MDIDFIDLLKLEEFSTGCSDKIRMRHFFKPDTDLIFFTQKLDPNPTVKDPNPQLCKFGVNTVFGLICEHSIICAECHTSQSARLMAGT